MTSAEFFFRQSGIFQVPWFTPAMCGGGFQFANPIDITYSVPQFLSMLSNPLTAVFLTHVIFVLIGALGTYILVRATPFNLSLWPALVASTFFAFNGFFMARMLTGHLNFHTFMLLPVIAYCLLRNTTFASTIAGLLAAIILVAGGAHIVIPIALSILMVLCLESGYTNRLSKKDIIRSVTIAGAVALALSAAKLSVTFSLLSNFPRSLYSLQGVESFFHALWMPIAALVWQINPPGDLHGNLILRSHEFEYSLSPVIIPCLLLSAYFAIKHYPKRFTRILLLMLPISLPILMVNYYQPQWHDLLKEIPIVSSSLSLFRWYSSFILFLAIVGAIGIEQLPRKLTIVVSLAAMVATATWQIGRDADWKNTTTVNYRTILDGLEKSRSNGIQPITHLSVKKNSEGIVTPVHIGIDAHFTEGHSQVFCYEPILGYNNELLKIENIRIAPILYQVGNELNMKNPACYTFPKANGCQPGDNFTLLQKQELLSFTTYRSWHFYMPWYQHLANKLTLITWPLILLYLFIASLRRTILTR